MSDLPTAVSAYLRARADADSAPPWARIMREDIVAARMRELLAACFGADVTLDDALVLHAPDFVHKQAQEWSAMAARIAPPAPVVLARWDIGDGWRVRYSLDADPILENAVALSNEIGAHVALDDRPMFQVSKGGQAGADDLDKWMRAQGWVLLDAEPLPEPVALGAWYSIGNVRHKDANLKDAVVRVRVEDWGWIIDRNWFGGEYDCLAHGPQIGDEGERLAMVAALALGFVEGA